MNKKKNPIIYRHIAALRRTRSWPKKNKKETINKKRPFS